MDVVDTRQAAGVVALITIEDQRLSEVVRYCLIASRNGLCMFKCIACNQAQLGIAQGDRTSIADLDLGQHPFDFIHGNRSEHHTAKRSVWLVDPTDEGPDPLIVGSANQRIADMHACVRILFQGNEIGTIGVIVGHGLGTQSVKDITVFVGCPDITDVREAGVLSSQVNIERGRIKFAVSHLPGNFIGCR